MQRKDHCSPKVDELVPFLNGDTYLFVLMIISATPRTKKTRWKKRINRISSRKTFQFTFSRILFGNTFSHSIHFRNRNHENPCKSFEIRANDTNITAGSQDKIKSECPFLGNLTHENGPFLMLETKGNIIWPSISDGKNYFTIAPSKICKNFHYEIQF